MGHGDGATLRTVKLTYHQATAARHITRDPLHTHMPQRQHLAVVPVLVRPALSRPGAPKPPRAPLAEATFSPLIQEFLEECGYSDK